MEIIKRVLKYWQFYAASLLCVVWLGVIILYGM